jgi:uncharacterized protein (DUF2252 family)
MSTHLSRLQQLHAPTITHADAIAAGRAARARTPRSAHRHFEPGDRAPLAILEAQNESRLASLVPLRLSRMLASPFAFYRGTAGIMAADLARCPSSGIEVVSCGDAHISNFGLFASPQRTMVFDLNDFDEAAPAPFEWDVKRLVTSVVVGARDAAFSDKDTRTASRHAVRAYREALLEMMRLNVLQRYYLRADTAVAHSALGSAAQKVLNRATKQAQKRTSERFVAKITTLAPDGTRVIVEDPPVLTHLPEAVETDIEELFERYRRTVPADIALLLSQFSLTDLVMRVVGVGSVGTRCYLLILTGPQRESLVLQVKEAQPSVLHTFGGVPVPGTGIRDSETDAGFEGRRVVANQRILQAVSDSFLGYLRADGRDYYVRQFRDQKGSIELQGLRPGEYVTYVDGCATLLARAHAQSPVAPMIAGYLGRGAAFDRAIVDWSVEYADQSLADYNLLREAMSYDTRHGD